MSKDDPDHWCDNRTCCLYCTGEYIIAPAFPPKDRRIVCCNCGREK